MEGGEDERQPLFQNQSKPAYSTPPVNNQAGDYEAINQSNPINPVGADEVPPPYTIVNQNGPPEVTCRVCQAVLDITEKRDQHVVKCTRCSEATPIRKPPAGKKYVRCPCNCLLICKSSSQRIACPRPNCKRVINLAPSPVTPPAPALADMIIVTCVHCDDTFLYRTSHRGPARCPHCRKVSAIGQHYTRGRALLYAIAVFLLLTFGIGITLGTYRYAAGGAGGIYVVYVGAFILAFLAFCKCVQYYCMKTSSTADIR